MSIETMYAVFWEGPFDWDKKHKFVKRHHFLYQIYGTHPVYGRDVLLYIGSTSRDMLARLREHKEWVDDEYDAVQVRFGSIREFRSWTQVDKNKSLTKVTPSILGHIEALLIYSNQPAYNVRSKSDAALAENIRIFNYGRLGQVLPEVSHKYFFGD